MKHHHFFAFLSLMLAVTAATAAQPVETSLKRAGSSMVDLRDLPDSKPEIRYQPEPEAPPVEREELPGGLPDTPAKAPGLQAAAPSALTSFLGLDFANWGSGRPPNTAGDVGPTYYIEAVNTAIGIYRKADSVRVAAFSFDTFMSQGSFGNLCDAHNFGDPVVLYDTFEDRWVITDFAFQLDNSSNVIAPPGAFQCFAVSKTGDPVAGGWNYYSLHIADALNDDVKLGIWPDGIYMSANMVAFPSGGTFQGTRVWALNKAQMYAGAPAVQVVAFNPPTAEFTLLPANARLQAGSPPVGSPNYFSVVWQLTNGLSLYKFHVDWNSISLSSFTGPFTVIAPATWVDPPDTVPAQGGNNNETLGIRLMTQSQYTNLGGVESLWSSHTVQNPAAPGVAAVRYYQTTVTGGTVAANTTQAATHAPDTTVSRYVPSLAVDHAGNMALGYSASGSALMPAIRYAGRLSTDAVDTLSQTETSLIEGTGAQNVTTRWGESSAMSLDPDGCTFWYANEYYITTGGDWQTRVASFAYPSCVPLVNGAVQGTVTAAAGGAPLGGATVTFGSRTTATGPDGFYSFPAIPPGTYPGIAASAPGFNVSSATSIPVTGGGTTTRDFSLSTAPAGACLADTSQADFQAGVPANVDLTTNPGDAALQSTASIDQQNSTLGTGANNITVTTWGGQTFVPSVTAQLTRVDINLVCNGCTGTTPSLTLSIRATSGGLPAGGDLASGVISGFNSNTPAYYSAIFNAPPTLTAGTQYALVLRPTVNPSAGTYALTRSGTATLGADVYAGGTRVNGLASGTSWSSLAPGGVTTDIGFKTFTASGTLVSALKDSNPPPTYTTLWSTLSWTGSAPANTVLRFQAAGSNSALGPFTFVGPDGTAATFFTASGVSLSQLDGKRYLKYKAYFSTTDSASTPTLSDVTLCYTVAPPQDLSLTKSDGGASGAPGGTVAYTLTYTNSGGQAATGTVLTETVPANSTFNAGASTPGWLCAPDANAGSGCTLSVATVPAGGTAAATFAVDVVSPVAAGVVQLANTAGVAEDGTHGAETTPGNNTGGDTTPVDAAPDLTLTQSDGGASVAPGGSVAYTLTYANAGNQGATGAVLTETVPANTTFNAGASTAGWLCAPDSGAGSSCTLPVGALVAGGGNQTAIFALTVNTPIAAGVTQISNTASIADDGANGTDPTPANNAGSDTTPLTGAPDLSLSKSDGGASVAPGGTVAYTLTYANHGNRGASGVSLAETVPANTAFNAGASTAGWFCTPTLNAGSTCTLNLGTLAAGGGSQAATFSATVITPIAAGVTQISNTASIANDGANGLDPTPADNSAGDTTPLTGAPDLTLTNSDGGVSASTGGTATYTLTYSNAGNRGASSLILTETVPANTVFKAAASTAGWTCTPNVNPGSTCKLMVAAMAGGGNQTALFAVTVARSMPAGVTQITNTASITDDGTNGIDPTPANNSAADTTPVVITIGYFYTLTPCRVVETRSANGPRGGPALTGGTVRSFPIAGNCGVPADAMAVAINVTVTEPTAAGDLGLAPTSTVSPVMTTINFKAGQTRANNSVMGLNGTTPGWISVQVHLPASATTQFIIDVTGYFK